MKERKKHLALGAVIVAGTVVAIGTPADAHIHTAKGNTIANGQHHPIFTATGTACDTSAGPGGAEVGPAWYGLETAHHGPDTGTSGRADGCYQTEVQQLPSGAWVPKYDTNPAID